MHAKASLHLPQFIVFKGNRLTTAIFKLLNTYKSITETRTTKINGCVKQLYLSKACIVILIVKTLLSKLFISFEMNISKTLGILTIKEFYPL